MVLLVALVVIGLVQATGLPFELVTQSQLATDGSDLNDAAFSIPDEAVRRLVQEDPADDEVCSALRECSSNDDQRLYSGGCPVLFEPAKLWCYTSGENWCCASSGSTHDCCRLSPGGWIVAFGIPILVLLSLVCFTCAFYRGCPWSIGMYENNERHSHLPSIHEDAKSDDHLGMEPRPEQPIDIVAVINQAYGFDFDSSQY